MTLLYRAILQICRIENDSHILYTGDAGVNAYDDI